MGSIETLFLKIHHYCIILTFASCRLSLALSVACRLSASLELICLACLLITHLCIVCSSTVGGKDQNHEQ